MSKLILFTIFLLGQFLLSAQNKLEWTDNNKLTLDDFQANAPNTGTIQTVQVHITIEYQMATYEMLASKNFNKNVTNYLYRSASWIDKGESDKRLLRYAQTIFDMNEWMARRLRKSFRENKGQLLSGRQNEIYEQLTREFAEIQSQYAKDTDFGSKDEKQLEWEIKVNENLNQLADFCKTCKPAKKK